MPVDYSKAKIYALRSYQTDQIYIGSTCSPLSKRLWGHKADYVRRDRKGYITSFEIIKYDDCYIELIEEYPCENKEQLHRHEGEHIRETDNCVNKIIAGRSKNEYYKEAGEIEKKREYFQKNKDKITDYQIKYREANVEKLRAQKKEYSERNRNVIKEKANVRVQCDVCGFMALKYQLPRHKTSKKCSSYK